MANIVSFRGGTVFQDASGKDTSIAARGTNQEPVSLFLLASGTSSGTEAAGAFAGHFRQSKFQDIASLVRGGRRQITITGSGGPGDYTPINYSSP